MKSLYKTIFSVFSLVVFLFPAVSVDAYVSVSGYYRSDGTYVRPHVRSNPNGLKYDNYSWTPSQGLYNSTYGTRGANWDTPTYITDPDYYEGKALYESGQSGSSYTAPTLSTYKSTSNNVDVPANASLNYFGTSWSCDSGYKTKYDSSYNKVGCTKIAVPTNASLNYYGSDWTCDSGYKTTYNSSYTKIGCEKIDVPSNASLNYYGTDWSCNSGYKTRYDSSYSKVGCTKIQIPSNASLNYYGTDWSCDSGYKTTYNSSYSKVGCEKIRVPSNASLNYYGTDWVCNSGYVTRYDNSYNKVGCKKS